MTIGPGALTAADSAARDTRAWEAVRADASIQYAPIGPPPPQVTPEWLLELGRFLERMLRPLGELFGMDWRWLKWGLVAAAVAGALWLVWALIVAPLLARRRAAGETVEWTPDSDAALALLEDADRLAAAGLYGEAAHLLLQRSVGQIAIQRPHALAPSSTSRELASAPGLPQRARTAFATIAEVVERSLFALRGAGEDDWRRARGAYADFALTEWRTG